jgi:hypothetical protein
MSLVREWLTTFVTALSALFAGLIWWMARKRLSSRYSLRVQHVTNDRFVDLVLSVTNRSDADLYVEYLSVNAPFGILKESDRASTIRYEATSHPPETMRRISYDWRIGPDEAPSRSVVLWSPDGVGSHKSISMRLHIRSNFWVMRHRKKVLRAILPDSMRKSQS